MKITKGRLRKLIREAIGGKAAAGPNTGVPFVDIAMNAIATGDVESATQAVLNGFMMDDTWQQEEDALEDQLAALGPGASKEEVEAVADGWLNDYRAGKFRPSEDQYEEQWKTGADRSRARFKKNTPALDEWNKRQGK
jgi:hypothetical protein